MVKQVLYNLPPKDVLDWIIMTIQSLPLSPPYVSFVTIHLWAEYRWTETLQCGPSTERPKLQSPNHGSPSTWFLPQQVFHCSFQFASHSPFLWFEKGIKIHSWKLTLSQKCRTYVLWRLGLLYRLFMLSQAIPIIKGHITHCQWPKPFIAVS